MISCASYVRTPNATSILNETTVHGIHESWLPHLAHESRLKMPHEGILKHPPQLPPSCLPPRVVLPPRSFQSIARKHARSYHPRRQPLRSQTEICHYSGSAHDDIPRHAKELEAGQTWDTSTTYQLYGCAWHTLPILTLPIRDKKLSLAKGLELPLRSPISGWRSRRWMWETLIPVLPRRLRVCIPNHHCFIRVVKIWKV